MDTKTALTNFGGALALVAGTYFVTQYLEGNKEAEDVAKIAAIANHPSIIALEGIVSRIELTQVRLEANQTQIANTVNDLRAAGLMR